MGLYNILFGVNPLSPILLKSLNLSYHGRKLQINGEYSPGRFRDIYLSDDGTKILLYTRNGGGNRECWDAEGCPVYPEEDIPQNHNPSCLVYVNWKLTQHPNYIKDYDDDFDSTYAYFEFKVPETLDPVLDRIMKAQGGPPVSVTQKFNEIIAEMREMPKEAFEKDPRFAPLADLLKSITSGKLRSEK